MSSKERKRKRPLGPEAEVEGGPSIAAKVPDIA